MQGTGYPVIMHHGYGATGNIWIAQMKELSKYFKVITLDSRGSGKSDHPVNPYTLNILVEDLKGLMDSLKIEKAHVIGQSMGGWIAQNFVFKLINEYEIFISDIVLLEIEQVTVDQKKQLLLDVISKYEIKALESSKEAEKLADIYIKEGIIPEKYYNDALHIAIATKNKMDAIVSWNLTHIVKFKTKYLIKKINKKFKEKDVIICTPEEMVY